MSLNYGVDLGSFTSFSDDEKLNYSLKIALQRLQTDLAVDWFQEPKDFIPKLPSELYKNNIPEYSSVKDYFLIDPDIGDGTECVTNVKVEDILTFTSNGSHFILTDIEDTTKIRNNDSYSTLTDTDFVDGSTRKQIKKLSRNMFTRYNYWKKGITGTDSPTLDSISEGTAQINGSLNSGTHSDKKEPENAIITYEGGSLASNRTFANMNAIRNKVLSDNAVGISIISPENKNDLTKKHPFLKLYLQVPLYTTRTSASVSENYSGGGTNTDNIGFHNPILSKSLGDVNGYLYSIVGWDTNKWESVTTAYGAAGNKNILYFLNNPGYILIYGVKNIVYDFLTSQKYPPMISFLKYTGETFADGIITQDSSDNIPPPEVSNVKDLYIDTTNNLIYRLDQSGNEKSWVSVGGSGGAGGGASSDAVVKLETLKTISRMGNEDSLVYQYTDSNELGKLSTNLVDIGAKQDILYNLDGTLSTGNFGYKWISIHLYKDGSNNYYLNGTSYSEELTNRIQYIKLDQILLENKLLDESRVKDLFDSTSNNVVGFATVTMNGTNRLGDLKKQWNAYNNDWLKITGNGVSYASMREGRHGCAYSFNTNEENGMVIDGDIVENDLRIMIGIYMENKNTNKEAVDGSIVIGKNYIGKRKPPVNGMLIEGTLSVGENVDISGNLELGGNVDISGYSLVKSSLGIGDVTSQSATLQVEKTSSYSYALHVNGGVTSQYQSSFTNAYSGMQISTLDNSGSYNIARFANSSNTSCLVVKDNVRVGIGLDSPFYNLDVNSTNNTSSNGWGSRFYTTPTSVFLSHKDGNGILVESTSNSSNNYLLQLKSKADTNLVDRVVVTNTGRVGIGQGTPNFPIHVEYGISTSGTTEFQSELTYFTVNTYGGVSSDNINNSNKTTQLSGYFSYGLWTNDIFYQSSDRRIKTNIVDVSDNVALDMLRTIPCRYYEYKDKIARGSEKTIGFIAQEVRDVMPMAVGMQKSIIPNEMRILDVSWIEVGDEYRLITELDDVSGVKYRFYLSDDISGNSEIKKEIVGNEDNTFTLEKKYKIVFCYGKEVDDFHTLDKNKLFALNFSATQELDRKVITLENENQGLQARNTELETEITTLKSELTAIKAHLGL